MLRLAAFFALLALALPAPAQMFSHGAPASALSSTPDGREHGVPAGATSPTPRPFGVNPPLRPPIFNHRRPLHRRPVLVPVPIYFPTYGPGYDYGYPSPADPPTDQSAELATPETPSDDGNASVASSEDSLRMAYLQGARDALAQQRDQLTSKPAPARHDPPAPARHTATDPKPEADDSPATVFIFKDGRKIETRNYAVMGTTLYDLSGPGVKKVQLTDLDTAATIKANDDRGITVKLP